ncbi:PREDICTED: filament-like plant protein isoform X2 [Lupinus angustifolius]|nr:PREDICTED: filament-like plant protein isoform X2 [Lupinus angustifolius]
MLFNFQGNIILLVSMMDKKRWLWKRKSSEKSPGETESSGSVSSHSERYSDEQEEPKESYNGSNQSPDVTSKVTACDEDDNVSSNISAQFPEEVTSKSVPTTGITNDGSLEGDENGENENIKNLKDGHLDDGLKNMSEKLSAALVNVNAKEDMVQQHAKVAEEAIAGWEKAEKEVAVLKKQLDVVTLRNSALEDRVAHLDGALKECVRQLRQTREEQEENIHDAIVEKTLDLESAKVELENKLVELQRKLDASNARSSIDIGMSQKVEYLEKENMALRHELLAKLEELEIMTIERDLSTQTAETASKQHLENIKKVAKLEAECRILKNIASRASYVNDHKSITASSFCVESLTDSQSDSGEPLNVVEIDTQKMSGSELNKCEPNCSDSWASALIAELDQFKSEKCRQQTPSSSVKIDLMDDFLEMERLVALPETKNINLVQEPVVANQCSNEETTLRVEFETMNQQMEELKDKLEKIEAEKAELEIALTNSEEHIEESRLQLREAENKLEELQRELENAYKSKQIVENYLLSMEADAQTLYAKVDLLEAEVVQEKALSDEIAMKCKDLEEELESKSVKVGLLEAEVDKERAMSDENAMKFKDLEEELESKSSKVELLEAEVDKERAVLDEIATKCKDLNEELESKSAKVDLLEIEVYKERAVSEEIAMKYKEFEEEILRSTASSYGEKKIKQEDLELAAGKLAECQKTIASLGNQLKSLATIEDFLIDTASIPASPILGARASGEMWKLHSNDTFSPKRDSISSRIADGSPCPSLNKNEESSPLSSSLSTSSAALPNHVSSEKSRNGFAKFFSRTKSGIRLEI